MDQSNEKINQLLAKLEVLFEKQHQFSKEINHLRYELNQLKKAPPQPRPKKEEKGIENQLPEEDIANSTEKVASTYTVASPTPTPSIATPQQRTPTEKIPPKGKSDLEKFIGENLINKIGIAITVIGVAIGAKYSIENDLISPLTRIILGYIFGLGLLGVGLQFKKKYSNYSAVLVSGAMAILYFITYAAYGLYALIPQLLAFVLMLVFTVFTVVAALHYNRQVIAHIGLVGAYAVPFLLSEGSGNAAILFSYMAFINAGILVIAIKKYWKPLYYVSFGFTWVIFMAWYFTSYGSYGDSRLAFLFNAVFFSIFYVIFLAYKLLQKEKFVRSDVVMVLLNSFVFYGIGYGILDHHSEAYPLVGAFTLLNAVVHFIAAVIIYKQKLVDKNIHFLIAGMVLVFLTLAVPVQLDGNWVTLLWIGMAALLFWIGRTKQVAFYEKLSYPLLLLAFISLLQDWSYVYDTYYIEDPSSRITSIVNVHFLTSVVFVAALVFMNKLFHDNRYPPGVNPQKRYYHLIRGALAVMLIFTVYYAVRMEIATYWNQLYIDSTLEVASDIEGYTDYLKDPHLRWLKSLWILHYSLLFVSLLSFFNLKKLKNKPLGWLNLGLLLIALLVFLTQGLFLLSELRESYLNQELAQYYNRGSFLLGIRYISFLFVGIALYSCYRYIRQMFPHKNYQRAFELLLHTSILWIASSELIQWLAIVASDQSYKLGLSILWGVYSLFLIAVGIWKKNQPMRVGAMVLFGITLLKLFFYDISHLNTIAKTIVFVSLGVLLLIISFLYTKYKYLISEDETPRKEL